MKIHFFVWSICPGGVTLCGVFDTEEAARRYSDRLGGYGNVYACKWAGVGVFPHFSKGKRIPTKWEALP